MTSHLRWPIALATLAGLGAAIWAIGSVGFSALAHAALRMGAGGFLLFCVGSLALSAILGAAWLASMPGQPLRQWPLFTWARMAREGANDLLPFSQVGGLVVGARTLTGAGLPGARVYAAMVVDLTTEMAGQVVFTLFGLAVLGSVLVDGTQHNVAPLAWVGAGVTIAMTGAFILLQKPMLKLAGALAEHLLPNAHISLDRLHAELSDIYRRRGAVAMSFLLNLLGWLAASLLGALALMLIGDPIPVWRVIALESLIFAIRAAAFVIPGAIGVQEAGYVLLGPLLGLDPQAAVALSLIKRARDIVIGLPSLIAWQANEMRPRRAGRA
ncbi:lysylphosphatidylglycerol synthase domain-containing protein [Sphingomonas oligoaromativorans]|uniref:lysylphosphatidylglycerol synthase domain-containing protein n=1 Tax=Sphingomonas oligoaromativorans TaxID=575322 RepID=UPI0014244640|nr:putative membrane protein [Sphingomonas oligoaromativorans]